MRPHRPKNLPLTIAPVPATDAGQCRTIPTAYIEELAIYSLIAPTDDRCRTSSRRRGYTRTDIGLAEIGDGNVIADHVC